jgi:hypothetical protein
MNKRILLFLVTGFVFIAGLFLLTERTQALPEYSAQTGEPCASCHVSPSGGGARTPRGQAWVGGGRSAAVPSLIESLELLGVHLTVDESALLKVPGEISPAQPLFLDAIQREGVHEWLENFGGN